MLVDAKNFLWRSLRTIRKANHFPLLLPHFRLASGGLQTLDRDPQPLDPTLAEALRLCDGTQTLSAVCRQSGAPRSAVLDVHEQDMLILWHEPVPPVAPTAAKARKIILSPHPDDATLCLGGMVLSSPPGSVIVVDIFTQTAWTRFPTELRDVPRIQSLRWAEELLMSRLSGAVLHDLHLPEALLRDHPQAGIFSDPPAAWDEEVTECLAAAIEKLSNEHPLATWYIPMAIGAHLDHRIVRESARRKLEDVGVPRRNIRFYEDLPYAQELGVPMNLDGAISGERLAPENIEIEDVHLWKIELNRVYWSQVGWGQLMKLIEYARRVGGGSAVERVWRYA